MTPVDIARLLTNASGKQLALAYQSHQIKDTTAETEHCIQALILFQAGMEAIINEEIHNHGLLAEVRQENEDLFVRFKSLSFKNKWYRSYEVLQIKETEYLKEYVLFYSQYRVPITHPKSIYLSLEKYRFTKIYKSPV